MRTILVFLFSLSVHFSASAQISRIMEIFPGTTTETSPKTHFDSLAVSDSLKIVVLTQQIQQLKLNEIIYLDELEKSKSAVIDDSIRHAQLISRIDSLRKITQGAPVAIDGDTLFSFYAALGGVTFIDRAVSAEENIYSLGKDRNAKPDSIYLLKLEGGHQTEIMYQHRVIMSVTNEDALWMNMPIDSLSYIKRATIVDAIKQLQKKHSLLQIFKRLGLFAMIICIQALLIYFTNWLYRKLKRYIIGISHTKFKPLIIRDYEFLDTKRQARIFIFSVNILRFFLIFMQLVITVPMLFSIFPQTKSFAMTLFGYILNPVKSILLAIVNYIPNLFTIIIIYYSIRYLIKGIRFLAKEVESGRLKIPGFYADWAMPSFNIIRFLFYAFMIAMIYPYLPGSGTGVFQGVSIFVGLIVSFGSSNIIGNIISGMVITYMRPFKVGDRIKINDTIGNVIEKTPFVTRIRTPKNEIITIPNSFVMSSHTTNYTTSARDFGLIIHTDIAFGYEVTWQKAHECLIKAAKRTTGIMKGKEPFVLDLGLEDNYNSYQINVYLSDADKMTNVMTELHSNIQDICIEEGIDMKSPLLVSIEK